MYVFHDMVLRINSIKLNIIILETSKNYKLIIKAKIGERVET